MDEDVIWIHPEAPGIDATRNRSEWSVCSGCGLKMHHQPHLRRRWVEFRHPVETGIGGTPCEERWCWPCAAKRWPQWIRIGGGWPKGWPVEVVGPPAALDF